MHDPHHIERTALNITRTVGSPASIIIHTLAFAGSFLAVLFEFIDFDRMLLILTTIVSLEAIYLAIFIQMTINYQSQNIAEVQENVEEIQEDVEELQEDVEEMTEEEESEEAAEERRKNEQKQTLDDIAANLRQLVEDVERLKNNHSHDTKPLL